MELIHSLASNKLETTIAFLANNGPYFYVVLLQRDKMQNGRKKNISSIFARKYFSLHKLRGKGKRKHDIIIQCTFFSIYLACYSWCPLGYMCLLRNKYQCEYRHLYFVYSRCWIVIVKMSHFVEFQKCEKKSTVNIVKRQCSWRWDFTENHEVEFHLGQ